PVRQTPKHHLCPPIDPPRRPCPTLRPRGKRQLRQMPTLAPTFRPTRDRAERDRRQPSAGALPVGGPVRMTGSRGRPGERSTASMNPWTAAEEQLPVLLSWVVCGSLGQPHDLFVGLVQHRNLRILL